MATVNKDFRIKSGLVVEGANATVNGSDIITEEALVGGTQTNISVTYDAQTKTVNFIAESGTDELAGGDGINYDANTKTISAKISTSTGLEFDGSDNIAINVGTGLGNSVIGELEIDRTTVDTWYDPAGAASTAETNAINHTNTALEDYTPTASLDATIDGYGYLKSADLSGYATETYVDTAVANLVDGAPALLDTLNEIAAAIGDDENFSVTVANLVAEKQDALTAGANIDITGDIISVTGLDTDDVSEGMNNQYFTSFRAETAISNALGESLQYASEGAGNVFGINPTYLANEITDGARSAISVEQGGSPLTYDSVNGVIGIGIGSQGGISLDGSNDLQVDRQVVDDWYEASGAVSDHANDTATHGVGEIVGTSEIQTLTNKSIDGSLNTITNIDNASLVNYTIEINGNVTNLGSSVTLDTDDISEGNNQYFTDERAIDAVSGADIYPNAVILNNLSKQVAATQTVGMIATVNGLTWAKSEYRSAKLTVKAKTASHTQLSEILVTLDGSDNVAITEYGIVYTDAELAVVSADVSGSDVRIRVTTLYSSTDVTVVGTLLV